MEWLLKQKHKDILNTFIPQCQRLMEGDASVIEDILKYRGKDPNSGEHDMGRILIYDVYIRDNLQTLMERKCFTFISTFMEELEALEGDTLEVTDNEAFYVKHYLEHVCRLKMGQIHELWNMFTPAIKGDVDYAAVNMMEHRVKSFYFSEIGHPEASYPIGSNDYSEEAKIAWDMHDVIREHLAWKMHPEGGTTYAWQSLSLRGWSDYPKLIIDDDTEIMIYRDFARRFRDTITQTCRGLEGDVLTATLAGIKGLAMLEYEHITSTETPLPEEEYVKVFGS